ncbi:MAG: hypothetical protein C0494_02940 [Sphingobium sp.]|nr:hypothetical protein [Sphingobium sp.]
MMKFSIAVAIMAMAQAASAADDRMARLNASDIRSALVGHMVRYERPGWTDTGVQEEFRDDGRWRGTRYNRGPSSFSGLWEIADDRLCVVAMQGLTGDRWAHGWVCREVWRGQQSGRLFMDHVIMLEGRQVVHVEALKPQL